jgi:hypothetical protein
MPYPVTFECDFVERRSRLTTFFRWLLAIPLFIWAYVYMIVGYLAIFVAWFAIVFTGRYPDGLYNFVAGFTRFLNRTTAYTLLLCDPYPPFGGAAEPTYPVRMQFAGPLPQYSRLKTFFRGLLAIPLWFLRYAITLLLEFAAFFAWFAVIITGKMPRGLFDMMAQAMAYTARSDAYLFLLTETYPPFSDDAARPAGLPGVA